jgi:hypothetical protein
MEVSDSLIRLLLCVRPGNKTPIPTAPTLQELGGPQSRSGHGDGKEQSNVAVEYRPPAVVASY